MSEHESGAQPIASGNTSAVLLRVCSNTRQGWEAHIQWQKSQQSSSRWQ